MTLTFVTGNQTKLDIANSIFGKFGIAIEQLIMELPEIQADSNTQIAEYSAKYAFQIIKKPLMVTDVGFFIPALGGFPGPYVKHMNQTLSPKQFQRLMFGETDRRLIIQETISLVDQNGIITSFTKDIVCQLALEPQGTGTLTDKFIIYQGFDVPAGTLSQEIKKEFFDNNLGHYVRAAEFVSTNL